MSKGRVRRAHHGAFDAPYKTTDRHGGTLQNGYELIYEFEVENMPVTVAVDAQGHSAHEIGPAEWRKRIGMFPLLEQRKRVYEVKRFSMGAATLHDQDFSTVTGVSVLLAERSR